MRRAKKSSGTRYIDSRIAQLKSDRDLSTNSADIMWYNRTMQELDWAKQAITGDYSDQCVLERTA
ncbi:MAG: hypothetical protein GY726_01155 [Proteobacteria bacterium]|nr:hypothetical protein [Pseudomonadota bacterium]